MRINIIDPSLLADQHLLAEYREIKMLPKMFLKSYNTALGIQFNRIKSSYTLNQGHGYFFYNKFNFIKERFELLLCEMRNRGYKTDFDILDLSKIPYQFFGDYTPNSEEIKVNVDRILLRISDKPSWYRYKGAVISDWNKFYNEGK